ncbi:hypothetical protein ACFQPF_08825 [Fictibacillus iocasae]|uniref:Uncharacterized protein n=1 Tax=Fictibacillus iocasae TaxID=2715437 RepID=A0ABW2NMU1_9BACL
MEYYGSGPQDQFYEEQYNYNYHPNHIKQLVKLCKKHRNQHVSILLMNGKTYDGFLEFSDEQNAYVALPLSAPEEQVNSRSQDGMTGYTLERYRVALASIAVISPYMYY